MVLVTASSQESSQEREISRRTTTIRGLNQWRLVTAAASHL